MFDFAAFQKGYTKSNVFLCGIDEAGRGPLAGPVCAAAVILPEGFPTGVLDDSKKLSPAARERARLAICSAADSWVVVLIAKKFGNKEATLSS